MLTAADRLAKQLLKALVYRVHPKLAAAFFTARGRAHSQRIVKEWGCVSLNEKLIQAFGNVVLDGPFEGLTLPPMTWAEHLGPYILGVYECELSPIWPMIFTSNYRQILDVGAKFGYYAVGLARHFPDTPVVAFDPDWWARQATEETATANRAKNVSVQHYCDPKWLKRYMTADALVFCDCDGYEKKLFTSMSIEKMRSATCIVETHDCFVPGTVAALAESFSASHTIWLIPTRDYPPKVTRDLGWLTEEEQLMAVQEYRPPQSWLFMIPRDTSKNDLVLAASKELGAAVA